MLKGKTALVTGSTSGIGLALATAFAAEGCTIVLNGFGDAREIEAIRAGLARDHGVTVTYSPADMSKGDEIAAMVAGTGVSFVAVGFLHFAGPDNLQHALAQRGVRVERVAATP